MKKIISALLIILLLCCQSVFANDQDDDFVPQEKEMNRIITVVADCLSSTFVLSCSKPGVNIPSTSVYVDEETGLPLRTSFFLADPVEYREEMSKYVNNEGSILSTILSLLNKSASDPFITAVYLLIASQDYHEGEYYLSGSTVFAYPENASVDSIANIWFDRQLVEGVIKLSIDLSVYCRDIQRTVVLKGDLLVYVDEDNRIVIEPDEDLTINGNTIGYRSFTF